MSGLAVHGVDHVAGRPILQGIDVEFAAGTVTALSGPSGSGKTTLLSIAGGLLEPTSGTTSYGGASMWRGSGDPRPEVALVLQVYGLVPILSAAENVSVALRARGVDPDDADEQALAALRRFHIGDLGERQVEELSGGQMQRVALARGLAVGAQVLLADEPTSELDEINRGLVLAELRAEAARGAVVVVATHDPAVVAACDRHLVIDEGRLSDHVEPVHLAAARAHLHGDAAPTDAPGLTEPGHRPEPAPGPASGPPVARREVAAVPPPDPAGQHEAAPAASADLSGLDDLDDLDDAAFRRPTT